MKKQTLTTMVAFLLAAIASNGQSGETQQQVNIVHYNGHDVQLLDTVYSKSSNYTPEQYLRDNGFDPTEVEIINMEGAPTQGVWVMESEGNYEFTWDCTDDGDSSGKEFFIKKECSGSSGNKINKKELVRIIEQGEGDEAFEIELDQLEEIVWSEMENISGSVTDMNVKVVQVINDDGDEEERVWVNGEEVDPASVEGTLLFQETPEKSGQVIVKSGDAQNEDKATRREMIVVERYVKSSADEHDKEAFFKSGDVMAGEPTTIALVADVPGDVPASMDEAELSIENLQFFPNPNEGKFNLRFELPHSGETQIDIYNTAGQRVYSEDLGTFDGEFRRDIDISEQPAGTYILHITQAGKHLAEKVILK